MARLYPQDFLLFFVSFFFFNDTATTEIYTLSLHDALPISLHGLLRLARLDQIREVVPGFGKARIGLGSRSEEHTSELQSHHDLVCRLLLEKKKSTKQLKNNENDKTAIANKL